jgi:hypothetical protein
VCDAAIIEQILARSMAREGWEGADAERSMMRDNICSMILFLFFSIWHASWHVRAGKAQTPSEA